VNGRAVAPPRWLHHRRFHFYKVASIQEAADRLHYFAALDENFAHILVHDQIDIPLAIAQFHVAQAMPFFRQRQKILPEK